MSAIADVRARQILDSRGNPTVEVDVRLESGAFGRAAVPSGASTGRARGGRAPRRRRPGYGGKGVAAGGRERERRDRRRRVRGLDAADQAALDRRADRARRHAEQGQARRERDPRRLARGREGGRGGARRPALPAPRRRRRAHAAGADDERDQRRRRTRQNSIDLQEFMVVPAGRRAFAEALRIGAETYHALRSVLHERGLATGVGDEGGFAPDLPVERGGDRGDPRGGRARRASRPGRDRARSGLDASSTATASTASRAGRRAAPRWSTFYAGLADEYPIVSIEDGLAEDDWDGWTALTERLGDRVQLVGDDLFVTNPRAAPARASTTASRTRSWSR